MNRLKELDKIKQLAVQAVAECDEPGCLGMAGPCSRCEIVIFATNCAVRFNAEVERIEALEILTELEAEGIYN